MEKVIEVACVVLLSVFIGVIISPPVHVDPKLMNAVTQVCVPNGGVEYVKYGGVATLKGNTGVYCNNGAFFRVKPIQ